MKRTVLKVVLSLVIVGGMIGVGSFNNSTNASQFTGAVGGCNAACIECCEAACNGLSGQQYTSCMNTCTHDQDGGCRINRKSKFESAYMLR